MRVSDRLSVVDRPLHLAESRHNRAPHRWILTKHKETFWIYANASVINGDEHFQYKTFLYTRNPYSSIFHTLCHQGVITVDHLIKREDGAVRERGPLFKIKPLNLGLLFQPSLEFDLIQK